MNLEDELRKALAREPVPAGFKDRLLARTMRRPWWQRRISLALAAGLAAGVAIPGGLLEYQREQRERGMEARKRLLAALSVTSNTLRHTKEMIRKSTRRS